MLTMSTHIQKSLLLEKKYITSPLNPTLIEAPLEGGTPPIFGYLSFISPTGGSRPPLPPLYSRHTIIL
jgi:hypothetical protein